MPRPTSRRERRKRELQERILDAGTELFSELGYDLTTLEQICERADVSRRTFYNYFPSKQHLVNTLSHTHMHEQSRRLLETALAHSPEAIARLRFFFQGTVDNIRNYAKLERMLIRKVVQEVSFDENNPREEVDHMKKLLEVIVREGQRRGDITSAYDADLLSETMAGALNAQMIDWAYDENYPISEKLLELLELMVAMLKIGMKKGR
jgi:AcrR family transcriptional regulator